MRLRELKARAAPAHRPVRPGRSLGPGRGHRRAHPLRRRGASTRPCGSPRVRPPGGASWSCRRGRSGRADPGPVRHRHGQARRLRAELLQRHRRLAVLRAGRLAGGRRRGAASAAPSSSPRRSRACCRSAPPTATSFAWTCACGPIPAATPPAVPVDAAIDYYQTVGQNWERAAFIKARACGRRPAARGGVPGGAGALHLAPAAGLRGHRRHPFHQAPDPRAPRLPTPRGAASARRGGREPEARAPAASARSSSSSRPSS